MALQRHILFAGVRHTMNPSFRAVPFLAAAAAALCLSSGAFAQDASTSAPAAGPHQGGDHAEWKKAHEEHRKAHEARRAQMLHDILSIRSDQEPAFQAFLADMKPQPREHKDWGEHKDGAEHKDASAAPLTTPERLDRMAAFMAKRTAERQASFQRRADAIKRFYAVLGPEQKRAFDALHAMRGGGMRGGRPGGGEGHEGGPGGHSGWGGDREHGEAS